MQICPDSQAPAAAIEEFAQPASALDVRPSVPQTFEQRLIGIRPYLAKGPLIDAPQIIMPPELVGVHVAVKIYAPDPHSADPTSLAWAHSHPAAGPSDTDLDPSGIER